MNSRVFETNKGGCRESEKSGSNIDSLKVLDFMNKEIDKFYDINKEN